MCKLVIYLNACEHVTQMKCGPAGALGQGQNTALVVETQKPYAAWLNSRDLAVKPTLEQKTMPFFFRCGIRKKFVNKL